MHKIEKKAVHVFFSVEYYNMVFPDISLYKEVSSFSRGKPIMPHHRLIYLIRNNYPFRHFKRASVKSPKCTMSTQMTIFIVLFITAYAPSFVAASCSASCQTTEYCLSSSPAVCEPIIYTNIIFLSTSIASSTSDAFNIIMVSDAQFYYTTCKGAPGDFCIFDPSTYSYANVRAEKNALETAEDIQLKCVQKLMATTPL